MKLSTNLNTNSIPSNEQYAAPTPNHSKILQIKDYQPLKKPNDFSRLNKIAEDNAISPYGQMESFLTKAKQESGLIPTQVTKQLLDLKNNKIPEGFIIIKNIPIDSKLINTPTQLKFNPQEKKSYVSEFIAASIAQIIGEPFNYIQEQHGDIFRSVRPTKENKNGQTSDGSKVLLELHTENAFHPFKPSYLMLTCLRGDRNNKAMTIVSPLVSIIKKLDNETIQELKKEKYLVGIDESFGNKNRDKGNYTKLSVLKEDKTGFHIVYDADLMQGIDKDSSSALKKLKNAIEKSQLEVNLQKGDCLVFNNSKVIHGRTSYDPHFDGNDRWLQRVLISDSPKFSKDIPTQGRIIRDIF